MIGVFAALDALLFYVFWEAMLVPMFLIIGVWGGERRVYATVKFFLYTFLGSVLHAGRAHLHVPAGRQLLDRSRSTTLPLAHDRADADLPRVPARVRGQGADVAGAHLAAGRARRGTDRRLRDPGRDPAEDGRLRLHPLQPADRAGREPVSSRGS